jgi:hypothetical protein
MSFWDELVEELRLLGETIAEWAVLIGIALLVLIVGRFILKWVRRIIEGLLGANFLQPVWERSGISGALEGTGQTPASITATVVYAYLWVALWLVVARILKLDTIVDLLERLLAFLPLLVLAAFVVIMAAAIGSWVADLVRPFARENHVGWLAWVVQVAIIVFGALFALNLLDITFASNIVLIVVAALGVAFAIAFGVGGIDTAKEWWARYGTPSALGGSKD